MFFKNFKVWETELAGRKLTLETGKMAGLANAAILARYGETEVLCTVTASAKPREGVDFFPLSVDYEEKLYSVGKIPGSFIKREGKPTEAAILGMKSRAIIGLVFLTYMLLLGMLLINLEGKVVFL